MPSRPYDPHPPGGYRKPKLDGLFDDKTPPLKIKRTRGAGPDVSRLLEACRVALGALMNGSTDTQRHAAFHHLRGALKATEQEAAQPE